MSKKIVVKLDLHDNKDKQKAMKAVSVLVGIDAIAMDMASRKMTVIGTVDPVDVVSKLRKSWAAYIDSVGPAKEPEKKEEGKKEEPKKDGGGSGGGEKKEEPKKDEEAKKEDGGKKDDAKKDETKKEEGGGEKKAAAVAPAPMPMPMSALTPEYVNHPNHLNQYRPQHYPYAAPQYYYVRNMSMEENPNSCVIC